MQELIVFFIVIAALAYASWRIYQVFLRRNDPCFGCSGCALKGKIERNKVCNKKKVAEKFGNLKRI
jgi:hypothetical protein